MFNIRRARVVGMGITFLLYSFTAVGEARAQAAKDKMCGWIDSIAMVSGGFARGMRSRSAVAAEMAEMMQQRLVGNSIKGLPRKSLRHVNQRCYGVVADKRTQGWTPLLMAALKLSDRHLPIFRHLLANDADVGLRVPSREERQSAVPAAVRGRKGTQSVDKSTAEAMALLLFSPGSEQEARYEGATALHIAVDNPPAVAVAALLIENGADVADTTIAGATALHFASARGDIATLELLLEHQADVEARDDRGHTPLHWAAAEGSSSRAVMVLIDLAGADTEALTDSGETAYDLIMENSKLKESEAAAALRPNR